MEGMPPARNAAKDEAKPALNAKQAVEVAHATYEIALTMPKDPQP